MCLECGGCAWSAVDWQACLEWECAWSVVDWECAWSVVDWQVCLECGGMARTEVVHSVNKD